jgi:hypothetical protein
MEEPTEGDPKSVTGQVSSVQLPDISFFINCTKWNSLWIEVTT